jgi:LuxR family maltose regulon positive regulatory protein
MPKTAPCALIWSSDRGIYEFRHQGGISPHPLNAEDEHYFIRLVDGSSFAFQGKHGRLTLRKEPRQHGEGYWYAYRNHGRSTLKRYAGRTADLTITRLEEIAAALNAEPRSSTGEHSGTKGEGIPSLKTLSAVEDMRTVLQGRVLDPVTTSPSGQRAPLLAPKLRQPRLHASLVSRERLLTRLDAGLECKLTLLSAPAGYGKTTLVSQWVANRDHHHLPTVAWVSLDPGDNDPVRFWSYVILACQAFQATPGQSALALLHPAQQPPFELPPLEAALTMFLNELSQLPQADFHADALTGSVDATTSLPGSTRAILVLEDYHVITSPQIHETMTFLLDHLPPTLHLVIMTRVDPPLPLVRLRAGDDLNELHAADLRFSQEETRTFLQRAMPFPLSSEAITHLDAQMEGWATGLRLAALTFQGRINQQQVEPFLATFSGNHRHILEYFVTEVLDAQPEPLQAFLLQTSVLSRLTGPLCDAVTGRNDSDRLLEALERANLFLLPLDGTEQWYRYHPLFAEAMQHEARLRLGEDTLRACYARASSWYEQHGMLTEAVETAFLAGAFAHAAVLLEQFIGPRQFYELHEYHTLRRWLEALPEEILTQHPDLCFYFALVRFASERRVPASLELIERPLQLAENSWQAGDNRAGLGKVYAFRAVIVRLRGYLPQAALLARQALTWLPPGENQWRGTSLSSVGQEKLLAGELDVARQTFLEAHALFQAARNNYGARALLLELSDVYFLQGELRQAAELYREVLTTAGEDLADKGQALLGLARLSYEWNDLQAAEQEAQAASDLGTSLADEALQVHASLVLARIQHARGQTARAQQMLHALFARMQTQKPPLLQREILLWLARLQLAAGDLAAVQRWSTTRVMHGETVPLLQQEQEDLVAARLLIAQAKALALQPAQPEGSYGNGVADRNSQVDEALRLLEGWQVEAHQHGRTRSELEMLILMALAHFAQKRQSRASQLLREALVLAHAEGYQRLFLDEGDALTALLQTAMPAIRKELPITYVRTLLHAFARQQLEQVTPPASSPPASALLIDPLSPQEHRVLRLLVAGFSNPDIAEALVVSTNTVKSQVRSIYRKLNVNSRKDARDAVREQHLL